MHACIYKSHHGLYPLTDSSVTFWVQTPKKTLNPTIISNSECYGGLTMFIFAVCLQEGTLISIKIAQTNGRKRWVCTYLHVSTNRLMVMYVPVYAYVYVCMYVCMHGCIQSHAWLSMYLCRHVCMYACMDVPNCADKLEKMVSMYILTCVYIHAHERVCMYAYMYVSRDNMHVGI